MIAASRPAEARGRETKFAADLVSQIGLDGRFEGYASLFGVADLGGDVVVAGAFRESLARRGPLGVKMLWSHDPSRPIGVWEVLREDRRGLFVRGHLDLAVTQAREALALMKSGAVDGLSIGFKTQRSRRDPGTGGRRLEKLDLWEVSLVTFPMLPQARVSLVKRAGLPEHAALASAAGLDPGDRAIAGAIRRAARVFA